MFTEKDARRVATDWHGGQWSPLYMFASTGRLTDHRFTERDVLAEIARCLTHAEGDDADDLRSLAGWVLHQS